MRPRHEASGPGCGTRNTRWSWARAGLVVVSVLEAGCVPIPVGYEVTDTRIVSTETTQVPDEIQRTSLEADVRPESGRLEVRVSRQLKVGSFLRSQVAEEGRARTLVIGLLPGLGARWWVGETDDLGEEVLVQIPIVNCFLGPFLTIPAWFSEPGRDWTAPRPMGTAPPEEDPVRQDLVLSALIGWAKTSRPENREITRDEPVEYRVVERGLAGLEVTCREETTGFEASGVTDSEGTVTFDVAEWPVLLDEAFVAQVSARVLGDSPDSVRVELEKGLVGRSMTEALFRGDYPHDRVYLREGVVDFSPGVPRGAPRPTASVEVKPQDPRDPARLPCSVTIENQGRGSLFRLLARTKSEHNSLDGHVLVFGKVAPGEKVTREVRLPLTSLRPDETCSVELEFHEQHHNQPSSARFRIVGEAVLRPSLAWTHTVVDDEDLSRQATGNGDGVIQKGEAVDVVLTVKNTGRTIAEGVRIEVELPSDASLQAFGPTHLELGSIEPGGIARGTVNVHIRPTSTLQSIPIRVAVTEESFALRITDDRVLPFEERPVPVPLAIRQTVYVRGAEAILRAGASESAAEYGRASRGAALRAVGELDQWLQVEIPIDERERGAVDRAWVARSQVTSEPAGPEIQPATVAITRFSLPPIITFVDPPGDLRTTEDRILVVASVIAPGGKLRNVAFLVAEPGQSLRGMKAMQESPPPREATGNDERVLRQELHLPLGTTRARVVAENERGKQSERTLVITRVPMEGRTYLLAVGIDKYPGTKALKCAVADARSFRDFASKHLGVEADRSWLLIDEEATREAISDRFAELLKAKKEDTVIVFLAGHGHVERLGATEQKYFVPYVEEWGRFYSRAVALSDFERFLSSLRAERILVVADACHSGEIIAMRGGSIFSGLGGKGRIVLGYDGPAREDATLRHGYLTYFLLDGLVTGKADSDRDGSITIHEAYRHASREIERITGEGLWIAGEGELVLTRR